MIPPPSRVARTSAAALALLVLVGLAVAQTPSAPLRQPAEFEPLRGVMIGYPLGVPLSLAAEIAEDDELITVVADAAAENAARALYAANGVDLTHCSFLQAPVEDWWSRDWGPWFVFDSLGQQHIVDTLYEWPNSPGDDALPTAFARWMGLPVVPLNISTAGGNYMTDGLGTASASSFVFMNNPGMTLEQMNAELYSKLGITRHHIFNDPGPYWYHIDTCSKFLSPTKILISEVGPGHSQYQRLEDFVDYIEQQVTGYGTPYEVVRLFSPNLPYANSLILNGKVLVPTAGHALDAQALDTYRAAMPGYEVIGFPGPWAWYDALHCRTKDIADPGMLYVGHRPLLDRPAQAGGFPIVATVIAHSGTALSYGSPEVHYRVDHGGWQTLPMTYSAGDDYLAWIPEQPHGSVVEYWVHAEDTSGRKQDYPQVGGLAPKSFRVTSLGGETSAISAATGGAVEFHLDAGPANAGRSYSLLGSASGQTPGTLLPGGAVLPLNRDAFLARTRNSAGSSTFVDFAGTLDASGRASARLVLANVPTALRGATLDFAFVSPGSTIFVSDVATVRILD